MQAADNLINDKPFVMFFSKNVEKCRKFNEPKKRSGFNRS
jgi:hypothetical protein